MSDSESDYSSSAGESEHEPIFDHEKVNEEIAEIEERRRKVALELLGDLPSADVEPPDNVLFVCKLNPVTEEEDLDLIFSKFGEIKGCEVIRDWKTGASLQYAFIEYVERSACELAFERMKNTLIDDRRIHVDFSQSVRGAWLLYKEKGANVDPRDVDADEQLKGLRQMDVNGKGKGKGGKGKGKGKYKGRHGGLLSQHQADIKRARFS